MANSLNIIITIKVNLLQEILVDFNIAHLQIACSVIILAWHLLMLLWMVVDCTILLRGEIRLILQGWILLDLGRAYLTLFFICDAFYLIF